MLGFYINVIYNMCVYIYIYQSEVFPRTGYFIPAHVGTGAGQIWEILPPAPCGQFLGKKRRFQKSEVSEKKFLFARPT